jgi:hypothetical protein
LVDELEELLAVSAGIVAMGIAGDLHDEGKAGGATFKGFFGLEPCPRSAWLAGN